MRWFPFCLLLFLTYATQSQENTNTNKFRQLGQELPTPNAYRAASGAPGHDYWQQKVDYRIQLTLDDVNQRIAGEEVITYHNHSPDALSYLWLQLDQNMRAADSDTYKVRTNSVSNRMSVGQLARLESDFDGGFKLQKVQDTKGNDLPYVVNKTMMRIDLPTPLKPGEQTSFQIKWWYNINDRMKIGGRSGYEYFEEDDNYLYTIAQFYPRLCVYNEVDGWQNKQFLGRGEFALSFGDFDVSITVPEDHLVAATGELTNPKDVLSTEQIRRLGKAQRAFEQPVIIVNEDEARKNEQQKASKTKTWRFTAKNVRDFGFASSRKFIWDAMAVSVGKRTVMAMSMYPKEGNPLWEQYSTKAVAHTLRWFSHYTFDYPYPVAWSINAKSIGMEYPMICFNFGRPEKDGTYSKRTKYGMISVIIHEVGHNYFPMIVNSDERQWTWMDEGLNTFVQFLTEQHWERDYPSRRGPAHKIVDYMSGDKSSISPIMTNSESIFQFGNNAYGKPATALNILRESILGRELFDYAFREYSRRWMFKHPTPADFFRTMEDASGTDLDWFWRGWFYTNDHVDIELGEVNVFKLNTKDPHIENALAAEERADAPRDITTIRNANDIRQTYAEKDSLLNDFYNMHDPLDVSVLDEEDYERFLINLSDSERKVLAEDKNYYELTLRNVGGLVMPVILQFEYTDGTAEVVRIPAEIWRFGRTEIKKVFPRQKEIERIVLDPFLETADVDRSNNYFPPQREADRFELFKRRSFGGENTMQRQKRADERSDKNKS